MQKESPSTGVLLGYENMIIEGYIKKHKGLLVTLVLFSILSFFIAITILIKTSYVEFFMYILVSGIMFSVPIYLHSYIAILSNLVRLKKLKKININERSNYDSDNSYESVYSYEKKKIISKIKQNNIVYIYIQTAYILFLILFFQLLVLVHFTYNIIFIIVLIGLATTNFKYQRYAKY